MSAFVDALLAAARATLGTKEEGGKNRGHQIDGWNRDAGAALGSPWCAAWVYGMHKVAAALLGIPNPCPRTAGALKMWHMAPESSRRPLPAPGDVFVLDTGDPGGFGHVGIVEAVTPDGNTIVTLEGNSNEAGSREGTAVVQHTWKPRDGKRGRLLGYLSLGPEAIGVDGLPPSPFTAA